MGFRYGNRITRNFIELPQIGLYKSSLLGRGKSVRAAWRVKKDWGLEVRDTDQNPPGGNGFLLPLWREGVDSSRD